MELRLNDNYDVSIHVISEGQLIIQWPDQIDLGINDSLLFIAQILREKTKGRIIDIVPTYSCLGVFYDHTLIMVEEIIDIVSKATPISSHGNHQKVNEIPICYDLEFGIDLEEMSTFLSISVDEIIRLHIKPTYRVYFIGFLPGFPYLGSLDKRLITPRKNSPRIKIPGGSVGIGNNQTGIYPIESPGGWNIIGRCPVKLFNPYSSKPCAFNAGDLIRFVSISKSDYYSLRKKNA